ncbi:MAG TPA: zf-HC2 domain-containing protein [Gemmatimonadota bacterium]|jgi:hypothetical protein
MEHPTVPCRAFLEDFSAFIDGELSTARRAEIQAHVDCCQACLDHLTAYRRGVTVLRSIEADAPFDFWTRLERRLWLGEDLGVIEGEAARERRLVDRWFRPTPAVSVAAAAVLALFVIVRGLGPGTAPMRVGPERVQASVAITLPEVPEASAHRRPNRSAASDVAGTPAPGALEPAPADDSVDPAESALARAEARATVSFEREIRGLRERIFRESLGRPAMASSLVSDGWVEPVRLGSDWSRPTIQRAALIGPVTPAPWNVDQAVSLP